MLFINLMVFLNNMYIVENTFSYSLQVGCWNFFWLAFKQTTVANLMPSATLNGFIDNLVMLKIIVFSAFLGIGDAYYNDC